ncbi:MAG: hypothetical protein EOO04_06865 [Chitinophagaceae bacterium]|nr:MAG: hypothetical protein EOO04_06865 [Chitinophagaceae bacterium]
MLTLKPVLLLNGISSFITGIILVTVPTSVATLFGIEHNAPFIYAGAFLIAFALFVLRTALSKTASLLHLKLISFLDILWVVASLALVAADGSRISVLGNVIIIAIAAWVAMMAVLQSRASRQKLVADRV